MQNLTNPLTRNSIYSRIDKLSADSLPLWGKMNVNQMLVHCDLLLKIATHEISVKDKCNFLTRTIVKRLILKYRSITTKNLPTVKELDLVKEKICYHTNIEINKNLLKKTIENLLAKDDGHPGKHPVFGKLTKS